MCQILFRSDNGGGEFGATFTSPSVISNRKRRRYPLCDGRWHKLRAEKQKTTLSLIVDDIVVADVVSPASTSSADTWDPLYIGGIPGILGVYGIKIKSSFHSYYYAEACNKWRGPSPRLSAWATQKRRSGGEPLATQCPI